MFDSKPTELTVSQVSSAIKNVLEDTFYSIKVRGEISSLSCPASGHIYLNLKDNEAVLKTIIWKSSAQRIPFKLEDGLEVICTGKITNYAGSSSYQLIVNSIEISGQGTILAMLEKRKAKLAKEGFFDQSRKKPIPKFPKTVGVITSETGAVIKDILHRIRERFPLNVLLWPVTVQGQTAADEVVKALDGFNNSDFPNKPDVIIVARGGGSLEDLMPFNEESVVKAVARSEIPIISAIGHETDTTLIDYAADLRAPTPTAAAELATPVLDDLNYTLDKYNELLCSSMRNAISRRESRYFLLSNKISDHSSLIDKCSAHIEKLYSRSENAIKQKIINSLHYLSLKSSKISEKHLESKIENHTQNLNRFNIELIKNFTNLFTFKTESVEMNKKLLESYNYKKVLERGYAVVRNRNGYISKAVDFKSEFAEIEFSDAVIEVAKTKKPAKTKLQINNPNQSSLF